MAREAYKEIAFRSHTLRMIAFINKLIEGYLAQGYRLSVRQLYYQLVARDVVPNTERSYQNTASMLNDARMAGMIDWDAIEDRNRDIDVRSRWKSGSEILDGSARGYHMDMWENQEHRVFVIVEKAALAGVLDGVCRQWDVPLLAARGYPSVSIMRELVEDHMRPQIFDQQNVVLHFGDHDPSGIDMTRDLRERIETFAGSYVEAGANMPQVHRIALTMDQINAKKPPPNPAKVTDSRFDGYSKIFGDKSWELDALEPAYLAQLARKNIEAYVDTDQWQVRHDLVEDIRGKLAKVTTKFKKDYE